MPRGSYLLTDPHDGRPLASEHFACAYDPSGWRYVSEVRDPDGRPAGRVEVSTDPGWRQLRVEVRAGGWLLRGGSTGAEVTWVRHPGGGEEREPAAGFTGRSPAFLVATARLLALTPGARVRLRLVRLSEVLGASRLDQGWSCTGVDRHPAGQGSLSVQTYDVADLATGTVTEVHLAGDVVLGAPGVELVELDGPPSAPPPAQA